jgi:4-amino-4-deoxy-L-arabinose transferase-like glycosyltransferase
MQEMGLVLFFLMVIMPTGYFLWALFHVIFHAPTWKVRMIFWLALGLAVGALCYGLSTPAGREGLHRLSEGW